MDDSSPDAVVQALQACEVRLTELKEQAALTQAADTFRELAAQVTAEIDRRKGLDRRGSPRDTSDRRGIAPPPAIQL